MIEEIYIMWLRQVKQYWRSKERMIIGIAQPLLFLIALGFGFGPVYEKAGSGNYIQYLVPGIIGMTILMNSVMNGISLIWDKQFGFLKETLVAPVSRLTLLLGRSFGGATISFIQGFLVLIISYLIGFRIESFSLVLLSFVIMFLIALMFTLVGTIIASKINDMHAFPMVMNFLIMPLFFLSGALFSIENFPRIIEFISRINPLTYCVDALRYTLTGVGSFNLTFSMIMITGFIIILLFIGKISFDRIET